MNVQVFYAGMLHREYPNINRIWPLSQVSKDLRQESLEIYNGCYIYVTGYMAGVNGWYRADQTPVREVDVPKELKLLVLLTT